MGVGQSFILLAQQGCKHQRKQRTVKMGKHKSAMKLMPKAQRDTKLPTIFNCPYCSHERCCIVKMHMDVDKKRASLRCKHCAVTFETENITSLTKPVDVYTEWMDLGMGALHEPQGPPAEASTEERDARADAQGDKSDSDEDLPRGFASYDGKRRTENGSKASSAPKSKMSKRATTVESIESEDDDDVDYQPKVTSKSSALSGSSDAGDSDGSGVAGGAKANPIGRKLTKTLESDSDSDLEESTAPISRSVTTLNDDSDSD
eukprot:m.37181 g.37181  ORF g.37181 m.37181 type:complete len:261 (-) comp10080_c0_seq2:274-1056(-)